MEKEVYQVVHHTCRSQCPVLRSCPWPGQVGWKVQLGMASELGDGMELSAASALPLGTSWFLVGSPGGCSWGISTDSWNELFCPGLSSGAVQVFWFPKRLNVFWGWGGWQCVGGVFLMLLSVWGVKSFTVLLCWFKSPNNSFRLYLCPFWPQNWFSCDSLCHACHLHLISVTAFAAKIWGPFLEFFLCFWEQAGVYTIKGLFAWHWLWMQWGVFSPTSVGGWGSSCSPTC